MDIYSRAIQKWLTADVSDDIWIWHSTPGQAVLAAAEVRSQKCVLRNFG